MDSYLWTLRVKNFISCPVNKFVLILHIYFQSSTAPNAFSVAFWASVKPVTPVMFMPS